MELLTPAMKEQISALAKLIREDKRTKEYEAAADAYNKDTGILAKITEYNVHQTALTAEFGKADRDDAVIVSIQKRIDDLYEAITHNESYQNFVRAKEESDAFVKMVNAELEFYITGRRACTHDCSSCHADCSGAQNAQHEHHHDHE